MPTPKLSDAVLAETMAVYKETGSARLACKKLKIGDSALRSRLAEAKRRENKAKAVPATKGGSAGRGLQQFRSQFDRSFIVPQKIKAALTGLGKSWVYETEFVRLAELSQTDLGAYRDEFSDHHLEVREGGRRRTIWVGTKAFADELREIVQ